MLKNNKFDPEKLCFKGYKKPKSYKPMNNIIGYDTETDLDGNLICAVNHLGKRYNVLNLARSLFEGIRETTNIITYNIDFEVNLLLKQIPEPNRNELRQTGSTEYNEIKYKILGKKYLGLSRKKVYVHIWDIAQFYKSSLQVAANKYLNTDKHHISYFQLDAAYIANHKLNIETACQQHASLTFQLANHFFDELSKMDIVTNKIYSTASIAAKAFHQNCTWQDASLLNKHRLDFLHAFQNSYAGGIFINQIRGSGYLYLYDVVSMYPNFMTKLKDIKGAQYHISCKYQPKAYYGSLLCRIKIDSHAMQPIGLLNGMTRYYPCGQFVKWITKQEYDYLISCKYQVDILQGYWIFPAHYKYPFKAYINKLITLKSEYKGNDAMKYNLVKIIMNSMYGKFIQLFVRENGNIDAGNEYNPIFAGFITGCSRVYMCQLAAKLPGQLFAAHTDSIITDKPIPDELLGNNLGDLCYVNQGTGLMVAPGMYEIGGKVKTRSFSRYKVQGKEYLDKNFSFTEYFKVHPNKEEIKLVINQVYSWRLGTIQHNQEEIGKFQNVKKKINLNAYKSRFWNEKTNTTNLLNSTQTSTPFMEYNLASDKQIIKKYGITVDPDFMFNNKIDSYKTKTSNVTPEEFDKQRKEEN